MLISALLQPVYGCFPRWPAEGTSWIHPDDLDVALTLIPSHRIFRREWRGGEYSRLIYGQQTIRARPSLWLVVDPGKYQVGDEVEIRSQLGKRQPGLAVVREVIWNRHTGSAEYQLEYRGLMLPQIFEDNDLSPVEFLHGDDADASA